MVTVSCAGSAPRRRCAGSKIACALIALIGRCWIFWINAALAGYPGLTLESYRERVPFAVLEPLLPLIAAMMDDMPWGAMDRPPTRLDIDETREWYRQLDRTGGAHHMVLFREPDGSVAGVADASWDARLPHRAWHHFTGVRRDRRGRGIAKGLKAAILQQLVSGHPELAVVATSNGQQNAAILSVNARLGFQPHRTYATYQIDRARLAAWLETARGKALQCVTSAQNET